MQNQQNVTQDLIGLEKKYWKAMVDHDLQTALSLTDFPCLVAGAHGVRSVDKEQYEKMFNAHQESIKEFIFDDDAEVRLLSPDTAVVAYKVHCTMEVEGDERQIDAIDTSTWIKRGDQWVCAMHTETELTH